jgi:peptidoglycan/LPS O-acetylase OafA/YrhL
MGTQMRSAGRHVPRAGFNRLLTIRTSRHDRRSAGLDGVRGLAALSVFVFHIWLYGAKGSKSNLSAEIFNEFRIGLICFFVLSGYLLYGAFARAARRQAGEVPMRRYLLRRGARILPAYYVSLIGSLILLEAVAGSPDVRMPDEGGFTLFFFFAQNYSDSTIMKLNPVTWTLCLEVAFYVLLPVLGAFAYHLAKGRRGPQVALLGGLVALGLAWNVVGYLDAWTQPATKALPAYLPYFAAGMLLSLLVEARREDGRALRLGGWSTAAVMLAGVALVLGNGWWHATSPGLAHDPLLVALHDLPAGIGFAIVILAVVAGRGLSLGWLRSRPLAELGVISYGFYLWHVPLILFVKEMAAETPTALELAALVSPLALAAGVASWLWVERPLMNAVSTRLARAPARA